MRFHPVRPGAADPKISPRRAARLYRLLTTLAEAPRSRPLLIRLGRAGMRTFYRDLNFLEASGIEVRTSKGRYELVPPLEQALGRLPFPQPELSFGDVFVLAKGKGPVPAKLRAQLRDLTS